MELKENQAALLLESDEEGEISINVVASDPHGLSGAICHALAEKLMNDEELQAQLLAMIEEE